ncbi:hypothetical protein D3C78_1712130 [compost metagenome]
MRKVPSGTGLLCSDVDVLPDGPHPEFVREWRQQENASVSETAQHFGIEVVQVLEATGSR